MGVGNKRRQAGGHNLSFCITTRSLVVSVGLPKPATNDARTCEDVVRYSEFGARVVRLRFDPTGRVYEDEREKHITGHLQLGGSAPQLNMGHRERYRTYRYIKGAEKTGNFWGKL